MQNIITSGKNRKIKKKMKKLNKKYDNPERVFKEFQKYKNSLENLDKRTLFNPASEMKKRREKRMKKM